MGHPGGTPGAPQGEKSRELNLIAIKNKQILKNNYIYEHLPPPLALPRPELVEGGRFREGRVFPFSVFCCSMWSKRVISRWPLFFCIKKTDLLTQVV